MKLNYSKLHPCGSCMASFTHNWFGFYVCIHKCENAYSHLLFSSCSSPADGLRSDVFGWRVLGPGARPVSLLPVLQARPHLRRVVQPLRWVRRPRTNKNPTRLTEIKRTLEFRLIEQYGFRKGHEFPSGQQYVTSIEKINLNSFNAWEWIYCILEVSEGRNSNCWLA